VDEETGHWVSNQATTFHEELHMENEEDGSNWKMIKARNSRGQLLVIKVGFMLAIGGQTCVRRRMKFTY
jgi:hypothetical protein